MSTKWKLPHPSPPVLWAFFLRHFVQMQVYRCLFHIPLFLQMVTTHTSSYASFFILNHVACIQLSTKRSPFLQLHTTPPWRRTVAHFHQPHTHTLLCCYQQCSVKTFMSTAEKKMSTSRHFSVHKVRWTINYGRYVPLQRIHSWVNCFSKSFLIW